MAEMRKNIIKEKLLNGQKTLTLMGVANPDQVDQLGPLDFDGIWLEAEHGPVDFADISDITRACDLWGKTSITRVHQNEPGVIYRTLDRGSQGICVPHINSAEEARRDRKEEDAQWAASELAPIGGPTMRCASHWSGETISVGEGASGAPARGLEPCPTKWFRRVPRRSLRHSVRRAENTQTTPQGSSASQHCTRTERRRG